LVTPGTGNARFGANIIFLRKTNSTKGFISAIDNRNMLVADIHCDSKKKLGFKQVKNISCVLL